MYRSDERAFHEKKLSHLLIIPDGNRRYAKRAYLADILLRDGNLDSLALSDKVSFDVIFQLETRIRRFVETEIDPFYNLDIIDYLKDLNVPQPYLSQAYKKGAANIDSIIRYTLTNKLASIISIYGLQPANLQRKNEEINAMLQAEIDQFNEWSQDEQLSRDVKFKFVGDLSLLKAHPKGFMYLDAAKGLEEDSTGERLRIFILAPYKYFLEVNQAIVDGKFEESRLIVPPVDFVIRTSDEKRISEALPIQTRNAEYIFRKQYFPDFTLDVFKGVLAEFYARQRRFGL